MTFPDKPPLRRPTMAEIAALPRNGLKVVSTFSGCGGSCLGFEMDGWTVLWASEFIPEAAATYRLNHPAVKLSTEDIRKVTAEQILAETGLEPGQLDVLEGSPPCASFSTAGKRSKAWGAVKKYSDKEQRCDDLFFEYIRLLRGLNPKAFVAENVTGLTIGEAKGMFAAIHAALRESGYRVLARILDASWLDVPQKRRRVIFTGIRDDLAAAAGLSEPLFPRPLPYRRILSEALPHAQKVVHDTSGEWGAGDVTEKPSPTISVGVNSINSLHFRVSGDLPPAGSPCADMPGDPPPPDITKYAIGDEAKKIMAGGASKFFQVVVPKLNEASGTVTAAGGAATIASVIHPCGQRKFSLGELRAVCGFPRDFVLTGSYEQRWERLGRAVPPPMMMAVARALREGFFAKLRPEDAAPTAAAEEDTW